MKMSIMINRATLLVALKPTVLIKNALVARLA